MDAGGGLMSKKSFAPTPQQKTAADPSLSVWVTANAGSGKTHVLVERVVRLLLEGAEPSAILCITYTKAAAAEMSARLFARLGAWTALDDQGLLSELQQLGLESAGAENLVRARRLFTRALETPGGLKIQTIHAFCEKLLHLFPVEAGLAPGFRILDERREQELRSDAVNMILKIAELGQDTELQGAFLKIINYTNSDGFGALIREFLKGAKGLRNLLGADLSLISFSYVLKTALGLGADENLESVHQSLCQIDRELYRLHAKNLSTHKPHYDFDAASLMLQATQTSNPFDILQKLAFTQDPKPRARKLYSDKFELTHPVTAEFLEAEKIRIVDLIFRYDLLQRVEATTNLFILAKAVHQKIESHKRQLGLYDFDDLISRTAKLLTGSRAAQWVLYKLDAGLKHILVDEAQDTSPAQWQIIKALADEFFAGAGRAQDNERTLFVVGDRKQSIFSFQGADAAAFAVARKNFEEQIKISDKELKNVDLSISYRSTQEILDAVNKVFPTSSPAQLGFTHDDKPEEPHQTNRLGMPGVVEIWPLFEPLEKEEEEPWIAPVDREPSSSPRRRLARDIAMTIKSWIGKRVIAARDRVVEPGDILILLQSRRPLFSMLIAELRRAGVPVAGADRLKLLESLAIQDLLALLQWILLPQDDHALACILKSPLLPQPLIEDQLFNLAHGRATASLWSRLKTKSDENAAMLANWQEFAQSAGPYNFFAKVLSERRLAMSARLGSEAEDATDALLDQALAYEQEYGQSLAGFLHWFTAQETSIKREMEKDTGEVRLMTVHGAKGLEANIVFLPDAASVPGGNNSMSKLLRVPDDKPGAGLPFWKLSGLTKSTVQEEWEGVEKIKVQAERNRLLYVAMTRACDELYICGVKSEKKIPSGCWYETVITALADQESFDGKRFGAEATFREAEAKAELSKDILPDWLHKSAPVETGIRIHSLTSLVSRHNHASKNYDRVAARRGNAIHTLLQDLPDIAPEKRETFARRKATRLRLDELEAVRLVQLFNNPELAPFFGSESRAEAELRGRLADDRMVSGRVDRIAILPTEILLLDYKSDRFASESLTLEHPYTQQLALYAELLKNAYPDRGVRAALLWTHNAKLEWVPQEFLTQARDQAITHLEAEAP
jgi:ATP-dependent helicase/nuclease subunit A